MLEPTVPIYTLLVRGPENIWVMYCIKQKPMQHPPHKVQLSQTTKANKPGALTSPNLTVAHRTENRASKYQCSTSLHRRLQFPDLIPFLFLQIPFLFQITARGSYRIQSALPLPTLVSTGGPVVLDSIPLDQLDHGCVMIVFFNQDVDG